MRLLWWRKPREDTEIEQARRRVARTAEIIADQRQEVNEVVEYHRNEMQINHLAERVRAALRDDPR